MLIKICLKIKNKRKTWNIDAGTNARRSLPTSKKKILHSVVGVDQIGERGRDEKNINVRVLGREELEN